jgi:glutamate-1-semialdehyde aminotransferase
MYAAQDSFISSNYWTDRIGPVAALATINKMKRLNVSNYLMQIGREVQEYWRKTADHHQIPIEVGGIFPLSHFVFVHQRNQELKTLFTQLMLDKGILATTAFYSSYAHKRKHLQTYFKAVDETFKTIAHILKVSTPKKYLKGQVCHSGFTRLI